MKTIVALVIAAAATLSTLALAGQSGGSYFVPEDGSALGTEQPPRMPPPPPRSPSPQR